MPQGPAARITDPVVHPLPGILVPGPPSLNVLIGFLPAWLGLPTAAAAGVMAAKQAADIAVAAAEATTAAAVGPAIPIAYAAEQTLKASTLASMSSMMASSGCSLNMCLVPAPVPPHGPGVVVDGSPTVLINNFPACRLGDTIIEPLGPPDKIAMGEPTVIIGQSGSGSGGSGSPGTPASATTSAIVGRTAPVAGPNTGGGNMGAGGSSSGSGGSSGVGATTEGGEPSASGGGGGGSAPGSGTTGGAALAKAAQAGTPLLEECAECNLAAASGPAD